MNYKLVEELGRILCGPAFSHVDPLERAAALDELRPTADALHTYLIEQRGEVMREALEQKLTTNVAFSNRLGVSRARITAMIRDGEKAKAKREAATEETGAKLNPEESSETQAPSKP